MLRLNPRRCGLVVALTALQLSVAHGPAAAQSTVLFGIGSGTLLGNGFENASAGLALKGQWLRGEGSFQRGLAAEYLRVEALGFDGAIHHFDALVVLRASPVKASLRPYVQGTIGLASQRVSGGTGMSRGITLGLAVGGLVPTRPLIDVGVDARVLWIDPRQADRTGHTVGFRLAGLVGIAVAF